MPDRAETAAAQWRRERPDIDPFPMEVLGRLMEAAHRFNRERLEPLFAEAGLRPGEFDVLATLRRAGAPHELAPTALYEALMLSSGGMTARLDRLERGGLISRRPNPEDRRGVRVALTDAGFRLIDELVARHVANERAILAPLTPDEQQTLNRLLRKLLAGSPQP